MNPTRGLFYKPGFLSVSERDDLLQELGKVRFTDRIVVDEFFDRYFPFAESFCKRFRAKIAKLFGRDQQFQQIFKPNDICRIFVNKQTPASRGNNRGSMDYHVDATPDPTTPCVTWVLTLRLDGASGGSVSFSNKADGTVKYTRDSFEFCPEDSSIYYFNGFYVEHGVRPLYKGMRYSIVVFATSRQTFQEVIRLWSGRCTPYVCMICRKTFANRLGYVRHRYYHMKRRREVIVELEEDGGNVLASATPHSEISD